MMCVPFSLSLSLSLFLSFPSRSQQAGLQEDMDDFSSFLKKETGGAAHGGANAIANAGKEDERKDPNRWW